MGALDTVSKSFLVGVSLGCLVCVIGLIIVIALPTNNNYNDGGGGNDEDSARPLPPSSAPGSRLIEAQDSRLGIYSKAAIATDAEPCAEVSLDILRRNGTAVDSAIAGLVCASVVHPHSHGLGGGFIMTVYKRSEKKAYTLMARETAPGKAEQNMFVNAAKGASTTSGLAIAVPGEAAGLYEAKKRFGNPDLTMLDLLQPSIKLCEEGNPVTPTLAGSIQKAKKRFQGVKKEWDATFTNPVTGDYYTTGEILKLPKLARTLRAVAADEREFYEGELATKIVHDLKEAGSIITEEDLRNYKATWDEPSTSSFNTTSTSRMNVFSSPPPASGAIVNNILGTMAQFNHKPADFKDPVTYQHFVEACKFGFAKRTLMGDWNDEEMRDSIQKLVQELTSDVSSRETRHQIRDDWTSQDPTFYGAKYESKTDSGTSHQSVLAENGDAVSVTSTVNTHFGSGIVSPQTGVFFNNEMDDFSTPGVKNSYGIEPSRANYIKPGRRPVSSMSPTIITDENGDVKLVVGASGGPRIITGTAWVAMLHLWGGMNIKESIESPRLHHQLLPMKVVYYPVFESKVLNFLKSVGHQVSDLPTSHGSIVQGVAVQFKGAVTANNDWRKSGAVAGY